MTTKERLLSVINTVMPLDDYSGDDCIFSVKYGITPTNMVYILQKLMDEFSFSMDDAFVDAMEMCTFAQFENLLEEYENQS